MQASHVHIAESSCSSTAVYLRDPDFELSMDEEVRLGWELSLADIEDELVLKQRDFLLDLASQTPTVFRFMSLVTSMRLAS